MKGFRSKQAAFISLSSEASNLLPPSETSEYGKNEDDIPIPDYDPVLETCGSSSSGVRIRGEAPSGAVVTKVKYEAVISHTSVQNLQIKLSNGQGTDKTILNFDGSGTIYSRFDGDLVKQWWNLEVKDCTEGETGSIDNFEIWVFFAGPPSPPENVQATNGTYANRVQVSWDAVADATYYEVYRDTDSGGGSMILIASPTGTSYSDTSVDDLVTYYYSVKACDSGGCTGLSTSNGGWADASGITEIFSDGFESGDTSAWSGVNTGAGDLTVCPGGAMNGTSQGLCVSVTTNKRKQVWDDTPSDETHYRARFYFDPNGLSMGNNEKIRIAQSRTGSDLIRPFSVQIRRYSGQYQLRLRAQSDLYVYTDTAWYTITNDVHVIEVDWQASSGPGADDGTLTFYLDGVLKQTLSGIDSDTQVVNTLKMGFTSRLEGKNISGTFYIDEFVSDSDAYIGP
jgi:subtilisin-like proprotein convertase family protein